MADNMRHVPKDSMMYGEDGTGLASSSNQMDDLEDVKDIFAELKISPSEPNPAASKGFTFSEVNCWRASSRKLVCCNFSSDGKILASAGHEKKTRFSHHTFSGHKYSIMSLDFHPKKTDLLCSCDSNGEIRYWNVTQLTYMGAIKSDFGQDGIHLVRFQPSTGQFLAAATGNVVSIFDVDTHTKKYTLQGHNTYMQWLCWDNTGEYLASVSEDQVKVWSISSGECIHEVSSKGNKFYSCVFHPSYTNLLVIGGFQSLELWDMVNNQRMTVQAHEGLIAALAQSPVTGMVASASHDKSVKLWK